MENHGSAKLFFIGIFVFIIISHLLIQCSWETVIISEKANL